MTTLETRTDENSLELLAQEIRAFVANGYASTQIAEESYATAGLKLAQAKERIRQTGEMTWGDFLSQHCKIKRRRADELIAIAEGRVPVEIARAKNRERVAAHRERKRAALRNAEVGDWDTHKEVAAAIASVDRKRQAVAEQQDEDAALAQFYAAWVVLPEHRRVEALLEIDATEYLGVGDV